MEVIFINNNDSCIIKAKISTTLSDVLKQILSKKKMTQQDLLETAIKDFVLNNLNLVLQNSDKGSK